MLKQRLLTAALLIPLVVASILLLSTAIFQGVLAIIVLLAAWEWFSIIGFKQNNQKLFSLLVFSLIIVLTSLLPTSSLLLLTVLIWLAVLIFIGVFAHKPLPAVALKLFMEKNTALMMSAVVLSLFWHGAVELHSSSSLGPQQLLYVMVLVWLADTGGYFAGKRWGKIPLAKAISPNKTWEGVGGALVLGMVWALIGFVLNFSGEISLFNWITLSVFALFISIIGDLFESLFKRCYQVKDSGNLLPGHGGMLDRIDSLIAAVPVFTAAIYFLGAS